MSYCIIDNGVIVNIAEASADFAASQGWIKNQGWGIGWVADGNGGFEPPPAPPTPVPQTCTPAQGLVALYALHGITEQQINDAIAAIADPVERYTAQIGYSRATEWRRDSPTMLALSALLGLGDAQLDALYAYAAGVAL